MCLACIQQGTPRHTHTHIVFFHLIVFLLLLLFVSFFPMRRFRIWIRIFLIWVFASGCSPPQSSHQPNMHISPSTTWHSLSQAARMKRSVTYTSLSPYTEAAIWKFYTCSVGSGGIEVELWSCVERMKHRRPPKYDHISQVLPSEKIYFRIYYICLLSYFPLLQKISRSLWQPQRALLRHCPIMCSICDTIDLLMYLTPRLSMWGKGHAITIFIVGEAATYEIPPLLAANGESHNWFSFTTVRPLYAGNDALWSEIRIPERYHVLCYTPIYCIFKILMFW